jgi:hypothetical protein
MNFLKLRQREVRRTLQRVEYVVVDPVSGPRDPETRPKRYENDVFGP